MCPPPGFAVRNSGLYTGCKDNRVLKRVSEVSELTLSRMAREEHFDCLVIGAGISGLDAAYHIQKHARWGLFEKRGTEHQFLTLFTF